MPVCGTMAMVTTPDFAWHHLSQPSSCVRLRTTSHTGPWWRLGPEAQRTVSGEIRERSGSLSTFRWECVLHLFIITFNVDPVKQGVNAWCYPGLRANQSLLLTMCMGSLLVWGDAVVIQTLLHFVYRKMVFWLCTRKALHAGPVWLCKSRDFETFSADRKRAGACSVLRPRIQFPRPGSRYVSLMFHGRCRR
jgi:hypothetical protein